MDAGRRCGRAARAGSFALALALGLGAGGGSARTAADDATPPTARDLAGAWSATLEHAGETTPFGLEIEPAAEGKAAVRMTIPAMHAARMPIGTMPVEWKDGHVALGPFRFRWDAEAGTLAGAVPEALAPVYAIPLLLRRVDRVDVPLRPEPGGRVASPEWTYDAGAPLWAGPRFADGIVYAGGADGRVHAVEAKTGSVRWTFLSGGGVRVRPVVHAGVVYFQADDGFLYALSAASGLERWRRRVVPTPVVRLPFDDPKSRYDRFGSDAAVAGGRLFLGTHEGRVLCLDPADGATVWEHATGDAVLAAPAVEGGRVFAGSFDKHLYALDAQTGRLLWKHDARAPVVSTPAVHDGRVIVGSRAYDLFALDAATGAPAWSRYLWFSWVESSPVVRDGFLYVGSSDAAAAFAFEAASGRPIWKTDVFGWAWGQPAVTASRVYVGTSSQVGYPAGHRAGVMALDRATGAVLWRAPAAASASGAFGYPGSPAVGDGRVYVTSLDGRVTAFAEKE
jgi:outer membrane protein assembly factor BamB